MLDARVFAGVEMRSMFAAILSGCSALFLTTCFSKSGNSVTHEKPQRATAMPAAVSTDSPELLDEILSFPLLQGLSFSPSHYLRSMAAIRRYSGREIGAALRRYYRTDGSQRLSGFDGQERIVFIVNSLLRDETRQDFASSFESIKGKLIVNDLASYPLVVEGGVPFFLSFGAGVRSGGYDIYGRIERLESESQFAEVIIPKESIVVACNRLTSSERFRKWTGKEYIRYRDLIRHQCVLSLEEDGLIDVPDAHLKVFRGPQTEREAAWDTFQQLLPKELKWDASKMKFVPVD